MSGGKLKATRVALAVFVLLGLYWGLSTLLLPQQTHQMLTREPFTPAFHAYLVFMSSMALTMVVAGIIALRDPLGNSGVIQAIIAFLVLDILVGTLYANLVVNPAEASVSTWVSALINLVLLAVLVVAYPREQAAS